jgi:hypothetical protein
MFGTSGTVEGLFGTAFAFVQLLIVLPLGRVIDTGNAKRYLLAELVLNVGVFVGFAFVDTVAHVVVMRVVQGFGATLLWITGSRWSAPSPSGRSGMRPTWSPPSSPRRVHRRRGARLPLAVPRRTRPGRRGDPRRLTRPGSGPLPNRTWSTVPDLEHGRQWETGVERT